jgi:hypothetical protein
MADAAFCTIGHVLFAYRDDPHIKAALNVG